MNDKFSSQKIAVLVSSVGRRSQLVECFRAAFRDLDITGKILGMDMAPAIAPAAYLVDKCFAAPHCSDPGFIDHVLKIAIAENVCLIVPTIDTELPVYAENRLRFLEHGIAVAVSDPQTVRIACDKFETHRWLMENGFPTPRQGSPGEVIQDLEHWKFPLILKPRFGSASAGVCVVKTPADLIRLTENGKDLIVQEMALGDEYTINFYVHEGRCVCAVPHRRIETRGGEVSKGITVKNDKLMSLAAKVAEKLPGARGPLNIQCFVGANGAVAFIEMNARFGGGFPLANRAGAKFPLWLLETLLERPSTATAEWQDGVFMLRYDQAVFVQGENTLNG